MTEVSFVDNKIVSIKLYIKCFKHRILILLFSNIINLLINWKVFKLKVSK